MIKDAQIIEMIDGIYVGYNPSYTLDTAVATAGRKFNDLLKTKISLPEMRTMMEGESVIGCRGLNNYLILLFRKMEAYSQQAQEVA